MKRYQDAERARMDCPPHSAGYTMWFSYQGYQHINTHPCGRRIEARQDCSLGWNTQSCTVIPTSQRERVRGKHLLL